MQELNSFLYLYCFKSAVKGTESGSVSPSLIVEKIFFRCCLHSAAGKVCAS